MLFFLFNIILCVALVRTDKSVQDSGDKKNITLVTNVTVSESVLSVPEKPEILERSLVIVKANDTTFNNTNIKKFDDFKPSRQFGGFENNFPFNQQSKSFNVYPPNNSPGNGWSESHSRQEESSIESPWKSTQIKFPAPTEARPYTFDNSYDRPPPVTNPIDLVYRQPSIQQTVPQTVPYSAPHSGIHSTLHSAPHSAPHSGIHSALHSALHSTPHSAPQPLLPETYLPPRTTKPPESMWKKFLDFTGLSHKSSISSPKSFLGDHHYGEQHSSYDNSYLDLSSYHGGNSLDHHYSSGPSYNAPKEHYHPVESHKGGGMHPWKNILKVLAAIIPIGLFLSALSPTIITVSPANSTSGRYNRKDESSEAILDKVATSLHSLQKLHQDGCEEKVFCELMVNAMSSKNAEEHLKNLLDNFIKGPIPNESTFTVILEAVKNQDCSPINCKNIKDAT